MEAEELLNKRAYSQVSSVDNAGRCQRSIQPTMS